LGTSVKNILYIVSTLEKSGPIHQLSYIIKYIDKNTFTPIILTLSPEDGQKSLKDYFTNILQVRVETLGFSRIKGMFFAKSKIEEFIKENHIDLAHSQGIRADALASKLNIPTVSTLRNYPYDDYPMTYGKLQGLLMAKFHLVHLTQIDHPYVVSRAISKMLQDKNHYVIDYIRNGIDIERFQGLNKDELREKLHIKKEKKVFISIGHLNSRKDPLSIIKAFKNAQIKESILIFLGEGALEKECRDEINNRKDIKLLGSKDNVHEYLGASDYFISASLAEGLPNTVLEAMACGLPCILSDISPHLEIYTMDKTSSLLFKVRDIEQLSNALKKIVNMDYLRMSKASKKITQETLNAQKMSLAYQKSYKTLLNI